MAFQEGPSIPHHIKARFAKKIEQSMLRKREYRKMLDQEIAELIKEKIWSALDIFSEEADLIEEAIDRLSLPKG